jgi:hypothetical protein
MPFHTVTCGILYREELVIGELSLMGYRIIAREILLVQEGMEMEIIFLGSVAHPITLATVAKMSQNSR